MKSFNGERCGFNEDEDVVGSVQPPFIHRLSIVLWWAHPMVSLPKLFCGHASTSCIFILIQPKLWSANNKVKQTPQDSTGWRHCSGCKESTKSPERVPLFRLCLACYG